MSPLLLYPVLIIGFVLTLPWLLIGAVMSLFFMIVEKADNTAEEVMGEPYKKARNYTGKAIFYTYLAIAGGAFFISIASGLFSNHRDCDYGGRSGQCQ